MVAIFCNSIIHFVVFFVKGLKLLVQMPRKKLHKFQANGFQPQIQNATCLLQLFRTISLFRPTLWLVLKKILPFEKLSHIQYNTVFSDDVCPSRFVADHPKLWQKRNLIGMLKKVFAQVLKMQHPPAII